jgi:TonB family protein
MNRPNPRLLLLCWLAASPLWPSSASGEAVALPTHFAILVGSPAADRSDSQGVLLVPGTVLPLEGDGVSIEQLELRSRELSRTAEQLRATLRLEDVQVTQTASRDMAVGREAAITPVSTGSSVEVKGTLLGFNAELATYRIVFSQRATTLADSTVSVRRGQRAVVGSRDAAEAAYVFLVLSPSLSEVPVKADPFAEPPRILAREPLPEYTPEAREARIQGVVILRLHIDTSGAVTRVTVLKGLPLGLDAAAAEAVRQWRFDPARDREGQPLAVEYTVTIQYRLPEAEKEGATEAPG